MKIKGGKEMKTFDDLLKFSFSISLEVAIAIITFTLLINKLNHENYLTYILIGTAIMLLVMSPFILYTHKSFMKLVRFIEKNENNLHIAESKE